MTIIRHYIPEKTLTVYVSRKVGEGGLAINEDNFDASIQRLEGYIENHKV